MSSPTSSALNWYTPQIARALSAEGRIVEVVGPLEAPRVPAWDDGSVRVFPSYRHGSVTAPLAMFERSLRSNASVVHIQHELFAYGGIATSPGIPMLTRALRVRNRRVVVTLHGVMSVDTITSDFARSNGITAPVGLIRRVWRALIRACCTSADVVHVHERTHGDILRTDYGFRGSIEVIPMGTTPPASHLDRATCRRNLGLAPSAHVLLFFGFLLERKGIVPLLRAVPQMLARDPELSVVIAGEVPGRLSARSPISSLIASLQDRERIRFLGFVPDRDIATVFHASDVAILPYTSIIAASGPLSLALGAARPVLLSRLFTRDLPGAPLTFEPDATGIARAVERFFASPTHRDELETYCASVRAERTWNVMASRLGRLYDEL